MSRPPALEVRGLTRAYGGVQALDSVSFDAAAGEVVGLIGPNGAGKTTCINIVSGLLAPDAGAVWLSGRDVTGWRAERLARSGLARTYQHVRLFPELTALQNVIVGRHSRRVAPLWQRLLLLERADREAAGTVARAAGILEELGIAHLADRPAGELAYGDRRRLEIARALAADPALLLLDEPAAGMSHPEVEQLIALLRRLPDGGLAVLVVEHNMHVVMRACSRVVVLDFGHLIASGTPPEIRANQRVIDAYLGSDADEPAGRRGALP